MSRPEPSRWARRSHPCSGTPMGPASSHAIFGSCKKTLRSHRCCDVSGLQYRWESDRLREQGQTREDLGCGHGQLCEEFDRSHRFCGIGGLQPRWKTHRVRGRDKPVKIWDATTGSCLKTLTGTPGFDSIVHAVAYSPDGKHIAVGSWDDNNSVKVWDAVNGSCLKALTGHTGGVWLCYRCPTAQMDNTSSRAPRTRPSDGLSWAPELSIWAVGRIRDVSQSPGSSSPATAGFGIVV